MVTGGKKEGVIQSARSEPKSRAFGVAFEVLFDRMEASIDCAVFGIGTNIAHVRSIGGGTGGRKDTTGKRKYSTGSWLGLGIWACFTAAAVVRRRANEVLRRRDTRSDDAT